LNSPQNLSEEHLVSIVMPAYNAVSYLSCAIQSAVDQTYNNWELLIVDDASTDSTLELAFEWAKKDPRIKVLPLGENQGVTKARNTALGQASGKYIAFLDSDDLWDPLKLQTQINFMESRECQISYTAYRRIDENNKILGHVSPPARITYPDLLKSNFIGNVTGVYNAKTLGKQYLEDFRHEDYVAWLKLVKRAGEAFSVGQELASYRVYTGSISSNKLRTIGWQWRIYRESQALNLVKSAWLLACYGVYALLKRI